MTAQGERGTLVVTGASRGIGAAIALLAGQRGYSVAVNFATGKAEAGGVVEQIVSAGGRACAIHADVAREEEVIRLFQTAERELGAITALVNNAGITGGFARVEDVSAEALARVMAVNVSGAFLCAREAVRRMSTRRGGAWRSHREYLVARRRIWIGWRVGSLRGFQRCDRQLHSRTGARGCDRRHSSQRGRSGTDQNRIARCQWRARSASEAYADNPHATRRPAAGSGRRSVMVAVSRRVVRYGSDFANWRRTLRSGRRKNRTHSRPSPRHLQRSMNRLDDFSIQSKSVGKAANLIVKTLAYNSCVTKDASRHAQGNGRVIVRKELARNHGGEVCELYTSLEKDLSRRSDRPCRPST